ncbi:dynein alpha chain, flagellar outer arm [Ceratobasidium sp. AG-Ba]|nr:dynein alpha chain, flagellar outer arm [Ceratobasidium sp. AG-Ba]
MGPHALLVLALACILRVTARNANRLVIQPTPAEEPITSNLSVTAGGYDNYFYRSNLTAATLVLTNPNSVSVQTPNRMIVAHPAGNSGSLTYWLPYDNTNQNLTVTLEPGSLRSAIGPNGLHGLQGTLLFSSNAELGTTQIGSIRQVRDYVEGGGLSQSLFNFTVTQLDQSVVWFSHLWLNGSILTFDNGSTISERYGYELRFQAENGTRFEVTPSTNGTFTPPTIRVIIPTDSSSLGRVSWSAQVNETNIPSLSVNQVFASDADAANNASLADVREQFAFLTSARVISSSAIEAVIGAAIERVNYTDGHVAHEETIGDYATFVNINSGHPERGNSVFLDYKMKDTHYLILPQLLTWALYNGTVDNATITRFLDTRAALQPNHTYRELLDRNVQYVMNTSRAFAQDPGDCRNLARIEPGVPVGNWRDSNPGIGWGIYPFDVSTVLQPAALHAIADLAALGVLESGLETIACECGLSIDLLYGNGSLNDTYSTPSNITATPQNVTIYGLSLLENGTSIPVMNSDLGFNLLYNRKISRELISAVLDALQPFPRGLLTNIGQLVANPAYDPNVTKTTELSRAAYHGTVSWSWQTSLMALGVRRVVDSCQGQNSAGLLAAGLQKPEWCGDSELFRALVRAQDNLGKAVAGSGPQVYSEVWSWTYDNAGKFNVTPLGQLASEGTETSAVQLWSFAALSLGGNNGAEPGTGASTNASGKVDPWWFMLMTGSFLAIFLLL